MYIHKKLAAIGAAYGTLLLFSPSLFAQDNYQPSAGDPPVQVARIGAAQGDVSFMASGSSQWTQGVSNYPMSSGDRLYTDQGARAEIESGSTTVRMWETTDLTLTNLTPTYEQLGLAQGSIRVRIYGLNPGSTVEVDTPNGSAVITQPGDYRVDSYSGDAGSDVIVNAGSVQITGPGGVNQEVDAGQAVQLTGTDQVTVTPVSVPAFDSLDQWSIDQDHAVLNSQSAQYVSPYTPGYQDLDANGSWSNTPEYGPVWYPTTVAPGWQPYTVGYWAYVAPWGYTWVDTAPWGYAPFHYGRWAMVGGRWGWCPGPRVVAPVYSPALVGFVGGSGVSIGFSFGGGGGVAAWFPLGVGEPFVPWYHASPAYARQVNVTNINITNIHNTTIVNNYNTFISNTRTVNNINQLNTTNFQYAHRNAVVAVPASAMSSGTPVTRAAVKLTPQQQQALASAPVHVAPSAPAPTHPTLPVRTNVKAPTAPPTLVTPHGLAKAVPAPNPNRAAPANLPKPKPASQLPKPAPGAVAGKPPVNTGHPGAPSNPSHPNQPAQGRTNNNPASNRPATPGATTGSKPNQPPPAQHPENQPKSPAPAQHPENQPPPKQTQPKPATPPAQHPENQPHPENNRPPAQTNRPENPPAEHPAPTTAHPEQHQPPTPSHQNAPQGQHPPAQKENKKPPPEQEHHD